MASESKAAMKAKVDELKNSVRTAKDDLRQLFRDMKIEYKQAKTVHKQATAHDLPWFWVVDLINPFKVARTDESQVIYHGP